MTPTQKKWLVAGGVGVAATATLVVLLRRANGSAEAPHPGIVGRAGRQLPTSFDRTSGGRRVRVYADDNMSIEDKIGLLQDRVAESVKNPEMRKLALKVTNKCAARDDVCEANAIHDWVKENIRYTGDIAPHRLDDGTVDSVDLFASAQAIVENRGGDCLPGDTLLFTDKHELVALKDLRAGAKIWGKDRWTEVKRVWFKGVLPVDVVHLNNGSTFRATGDHKVYVMICPKHPLDKDNGRGCFCPVEERSIERIPVSKLQERMIMLQPESVDFGDEEMDPRRAYIEGLFLSDGFSSHDSDFAISGQDGCRKEAQKREVEDICNALDMPTTWQRKYIVVRDKEWAIRMQSMGTRAFNKHALSLGLNEKAARELLRGIMADASVRDATLTTTSRELFLQARMLHRMLGVTCGESYLADHGGLGEHPIWRLYPRNAETTNKKFVRVRSIDRSLIDLPVYDLTTEDHYVYLPEADVTVSNCDEHVVIGSTLAILNGIPAQIRVTSPTKKGKDYYTHVYATFGLPKNDPKKWIASDTTLPGDTKFGTEWPYKRKIDAIA